MVTNEHLFFRKMMLCSSSVNCFINWLLVSNQYSFKKKKKDFNTRHLSLSFRVANLKHSSVFPTAIMSRTSGCTFRLQQNIMERKLYIILTKTIEKKRQTILTMIKWTKNQDWSCTCGVASWTCDLWHRTKDRGISRPVPGNPRPFSKWVDFPQ